MSRRRTQGLAWGASEALGCLFERLLALVAFRSLAFVAPEGLPRRELLAGFLALQAAPAGAYMERRVAYPPINKEDPNRCKWRTSNIAQALFTSIHIYLLLSSLLVISRCKTGKRPTRKERSCKICGSARWKVWRSHLPFRLFLGTDATDKDIAGGASK